jgi:hypothetical protein
MLKHCCESMDYWANYKCPEHPNIFECPDNLITFNGKSNRYGLIIHDGGSSSIEMKFCPWCGAKITAVRSSKSEVI